MSVSETAWPQVDGYILSVYVSLFPGFLGEFNFLVTQQTSQSYSGRPVVTAGQQQQRQGRNAAGGGGGMLADLQRKWRRGLSHFRGWGAEFGRRSVAVALWRDEEEGEQAQEEGWARYLGLVPAKPGLWHAAFLKINTTVFPFSSPACEPLQLLDFTTQPHTHTYTHRLAFLVP